MTPLKSEQKLRKLSPRQAEILLAIIKEPKGSDLAYSGWKLGGILSALQRNKLIQPLGKENRRSHWEIADENLMADIVENSNRVNELLRRIAGK